MTDAHMDEMTNGHQWKDPIERKIPGLGNLSLSSATLSSTQIIAHFLPRGYNEETKKIEVSVL